MKHTFLLLLMEAFLIFTCVQSNGQSSGSVSLYGGGASVKSIAVGGTSSDISETLYIGPGTHQVDGTWEIYSKNIVIDTAAHIEGAGTLRIYNAAVAGGWSGATSIDGNNSAHPVNVDISHQNAAGIQLVNMGFPADLAMDLWSNQNNTSTFYTGRNFNLDIDGANIFLDTQHPGDLKLSGSSVLNNYRKERMVVTGDSITSHMVKENFDQEFIFPVGIAPGDYTPASVANAAPATVSVSVQSYAGSIATEPDNQRGMNRTWHIFSNLGLAATVGLQNNNVTNLDSFNIGNHAITQWGATSTNITGDSLGDIAWQVNIGGAGLPSAMTTGINDEGTYRQRLYAALAINGAKEESYFTKASFRSGIAVFSLPIVLRDFNVAVQYCEVLLSWQSLSEEKGDHYEIQYAIDGKNFSTVASLPVSGSGTRYHFNYHQPNAGKGYYRLKMVDIDQRFLLSDVKAAQTTCEGKGPAIHIYPNPTTDNITITGLGNTTSFIRIVGMDGKIIFNMKTTADKQMINLLKYAASMYTVQIVQNNEVIMHTKVIKN